MMVIWARKFFSTFSKDMGKDQPWGEGPAIPMHFIGTRDG
jgi:hypothetical protein